MTASELARFLGNAIFGTIRFRRGAAAALPTLKDGEPAWTSDTHLLYVGSVSSGNILVTGSGGGGGAPAGTGYVHVTNGVYDTPSDIINATTVTTNANLTGPIISVGNATSVAQQTGTGTIFAMQASPTFTTQIVTPKVVGGPSTSSTLTFQTTTAAGATGADMIFKVGNNGATEGMRIKNDGTVNATSFIGALTGNASTATTASAVAVGGITGLGTGVGTALAINVGLAGAFVTFNGALGTPSSGTVTNLTGTASININGTVGATTPAAGTFTSLQATGNMTVDGDLLVSGNTVTFDTATITVEDPLIKLAKANAADAVDVGLYGLYTSSGSKYSGLFRDATDGKWKLFTALQEEPTTTVNTGGTGYTVGTIVASLEGSLANATGLPVAGGGTGNATATAYAPQFGGTTSTNPHQSGTAGTAGQVLKSGGAAAVGAYADDVASFGITIDGGGAAITTGVKGYVNIPYACTITSATLTGDQTGSIVIDVWKLAFSTSALPTVSNTITASAKPTLSSAKGSQDTTLTGWTTSVSAGDTVGFNVDSCTTTTKATLVLKVKKS